MTLRRVRTEARKARQRKYDAKRFYDNNHRLYRTAAWQRLRTHQLLKDPLCYRCGNMATVVHHTIEHHGHPNLFYDSSILESVCLDCHNTIEKQIETNGYSRDIGPDGYPLDPNHPVYVQQRRSNAEPPLDV